MLGGYRSDSNPEQISDAIVVELLGQAQQVARAPSTRGTRLSYTTVSNSMAAFNNSSERRAMDIFVILGPEALFTPEGELDDPFFIKVRPPALLGSMRRLIIHIRFDSASTVRACGVHNTNHRPSRRGPGLVQPSERGQALQEADHGSLATSIPAVMGTPRIPAARLRSPSLPGGVCGCAVEGDCRRSWAHHSGVVVRARRHADA